MLKVTSLIGFGASSLAESTIIDVVYADASTAAWDLAVDGDLVLTYDAADSHRITPRSSVIVDIDMWGAAGGWGQNGSGTTTAGAGAKVAITGLTLSLVEYSVLVGQGGQRGSAASLAGGWPDGGSHTVGFSPLIRGSGGGSTRFALSSDLVDNGVNLADWNDASSIYLAIAAGGGGASYGAFGHGGAGGATTGADGGDVAGDFGGHGGTQSAGGAGQSGRQGNGSDGGKYAGGNGPTTLSAASGAGGGGYYGGAGGAGYYGGGGGGSCFVSGSVSGSATSGSAATAPSGQPASYPNAGNGNSLNVGYNGVVVISLAA